MKRPLLIIFAVYAISALLILIRNPVLMDLFDSREPILFSLLIAVNGWLLLVALFLPVIPVIFAIVKLRPKIFVMLVMLVFAVVMYHELVILAGGSAATFTVKEEVQTTYQNHVYKVVSAGEMFGETQFVVYRCNENDLLCQRIFDLYTVPVKTTGNQSSFRVEDGKLYAVVRHEFGEKVFEIPTQ